MGRRGLEEEHSQDAQVARVRIPPIILLLLQKRLRTVETHKKGSLLLRKNCEAWKPVRKEGEDDSTQPKQNWRDKVKNNVNHLLSKYNITCINKYVEEITRVVQHKIKTLL